jgi:uncharacterized protein YidB (DUF937 family)
MHDSSHVELEDPMDVLNEVVTKGAAIIADKAPTTGLLNPLIDFLHRPETGGLQGLIMKFEKAGVGPQIQSWIGTGKPLPITPDEVTHAFGSKEIEELATKAGVSTEQASLQLSELLPQAIKHLSPDAKLPGARVFGDVATSLEEKFIK